MANPIPSTVPLGLSGDLVIDAAIHGYRWILGADRTIDWSVSNGFDGEAWATPDLARQQVQFALQLISYYTDVKFNYVGFYGSPSAASLAGSEINVTISGSTSLFSSSAIVARGVFPSSAYGTLAGDIILNGYSVLSSYRLTVWGVGGKGFAILLHELGHTLGLKHPHDDGGTGHPTLAAIGLAGLDIDWVSTMSYEDDFNWNTLQWNPATLMPLDVLGLQYLYGKNLTTNAGDSTFNLLLDNYYKTIWDASGADLISAKDSTVGWHIELPEYYPSSLVDTAVGFAMPISELSLSSPKNLTWLMGDYEIVWGSRFADEIIGDSWVNTFRGLGGNDLIDGGEGLDQAIYEAASSNYTWVKQFDGSWKVSDLRPGSPEGADTLRGIERLVFSDRQVDLSAPSGPIGNGPILQAAFQNILRAPTTWGSNPALAQTLSGLDQAAAVARLVQEADATTSVATLAYEFFTGKIPSAAGMDFLVSPTGPNANNLNSAYYQSFNLENRYINFAVNLGKLGEGKDLFAAQYGNLNLIEATKKAYTTIFGSAPTDAKVHALVDPRADYFAYYGQDGANGIGSKAAMVGWLLAEAVKADIGTYVTANNLFLTDLADGAVFAVDLVGAYHGTPYTG